MAKIILEHKSAPMASSRLPKVMSRSLKFPIRGKKGWYWLCQNRESMALSLPPDTLAWAPQMSSGLPWKHASPAWGQAKFTLPFLGPFAALIQRVEGVLCNQRTHISFPVLWFIQPNPPGAWARLSSWFSRTLPSLCLLFKFMDFKMFIVKSG